MITATALFALETYQRYVSPYKGFCCAHRKFTGRRSCSAYAKTVVQRLGALALRAAMARQFERCKASYRALRLADERSGSRQKKKHDWWDHCDCIPCDLADLACDCSP